MAACCKHLRFNYGIMDVTLNHSYVYILGPVSRIVKYFTIFLFLEAATFINIYESRVKFTITSELIVNLGVMSLDPCCKATWG